MDWYNIQHIRGNRIKKEILWYGDEMFQKVAGKKFLSKMTTTNNVLLLIMKKDKIFKGECSYASFLIEGFRWNTLQLSDQRSST